VIFGAGSLRGLVKMRDGRSKRVSSYDKSGGNADFIKIKKETKAIIADIKSAGCLHHIWITVNCTDKFYLRRTLLKMFWDNEKYPSVEVPLGDFFGVGHSKVSHYISLPLNMITGGVVEKANNAAMNCFFPMPFAERAKIEVVNECSEDILSFYFYIDYEELDKLENDILRFHSQWRRENPTKGLIKPVKDKFDINNFLRIRNKTGKDNYVIFEAEGRGHYVGCNLSIDNINPFTGFSWFGEGDDMFFIDGEKWPPSLHGTGTEDYFCAAWGYPAGKYYGPYHGISLAGPTEGESAYSGKWTMYRFHIEDSITFRKSILFSIEHGHGNSQSNDYSSTAYWYQTEPHKNFPQIPKPEDRLPIPDKESLKRFFKTI